MRASCAGSDWTKRLRFFVFLLCGFSSAVASRTLDPLTVSLANDLGTPISSVALLASALSLPYALAQPILQQHHFFLSHRLTRVMQVAFEKEGGSEQNPAKKAKTVWFSEI